MSDTRFGSWSVAESPVTIEYSLVVIEEIRHEVAEGFQKLSRGGVEVGGILYGAREGRTIRILAVRPIACEHARGPAFLLSDTDKQILEEQIEHELEDPRLADMICLGWFLSHTRSEIVLGDSDLEVYEKYFNAPWQVTMVIRPGRGGSMRAGFFVREHDGTVRSESSYLEFNFPDRLAGVLDRTPRGDRPMGGRRPATHIRESGAALVPRGQTLPAAPLPGPKLLPAPPPRSKWPWLVAWGVLVLVMIVLGLRYFVLGPGVAPLKLALVEHNGQLQIEWDHSARSVTSAVRGALSIQDGKAPRTFPLTPQDLAHGAYTYQRVSEDVEVRMSVESAGGEKVEETTTFLGAAPPPRSDAEERAKVAEEQRFQLQTEVDRLRHENTAQAARIQELQRNLKILQSRLDQPQPKVQ
jgi:hypothetical protein